MRQLRPFEVIEVKLKDNLPGQIAVTTKSTVHEVFPS